MSEEKEEMKTRSPWRWGRRALLAVILVAAVLVLLGWAFLPRIAEGVMRSMMGKAGLDQTEFRVENVSWDSAVIQDVSLAGDDWSVKVSRIKVGYNPYDLLKGRVQDVELEGLVANVVIAPKKSEESKGMEWIEQLPEAFKKLESIRASGAKVSIAREGRRVEREIDAAILKNGSGDIVAKVDMRDVKLEVVFARLVDQESSEVKLSLVEISPASFMSMLEVLLGVDEPLIPEGFKIKGGEMSGGIKIDGGVVQPLELQGELSGVQYDGGEKPIQLSSQEVLMSLTVGFSGSGRLKFSGKADSVSMPLDPSADFVLEQKEEASADWGVSIPWGGKNDQVVGYLKGLHLKGAYDAQPVSITDINTDFQMKGGLLEIKGSLVNGGVNVPLVYQHTLTDLEDERWDLAGKMELGPIDHSKPMPLLKAISGLFDLIEFTGKTATSMDFSTGSHKPFQATMATQVSDASLVISEGKVKADGVNGKFELHIIPLPDDAEGQEDPSFYTLDFTAQKMMVETQDALDYNLHHQIETSVAFTGKGKFGLEESILNGEVRGLSLHGEKDGSEIDFNEIQFKYALKGDVLTASGGMLLGGNVVPFNYWHERETRDDDQWDLKGVFQIKKAEIKESIENGVMFVDAMDGIGVTGKLAMKMDFTIGSEKDFDGVFSAALKEGGLVFADDGSVMEGVQGDIRLSSMKTKQTKDFHRVTAKKMAAFDMEMENLRLDYKMLPSGDIRLKNISLKALGGSIWLDPFLLPDGDADYQFKVRAKRLDLAQLAKLFPDFDGSISGRIDGLLPMKSVNGEFSPGRGGMYLTPRSRAKLRYDAGTKFSEGINKKTQEYDRMKMLENSLRNLDLKVLSIRLFDPRDKDKALVLKLQGQAHSIKGSPPIILNVNGFKPDDDTVDFFDLLLRHRDKLNFGL